MGLLRLTPFALALLLASCQPRVIEHLIVQRDTTIVTNHVKDSVFIRDSIYVKEQQKGDTIRITEYRDRWRERIKEVHDTTIVTKCDTMAVERIKEVQVSKPLPIGKKLRLRAFLPLLLLALVGWRREIIGLIKKLL